MYCSNCGTSNPDGSFHCLQCGALLQTTSGTGQQPIQYVQQPLSVTHAKNPALAAILSFFITGLGQIYNGQVLKGLVFFFLGGFFIFLMHLVIGFVAFPLFWIYNIFDAYSTANRLNRVAMLNPIRR